MNTNEIPATNEVGNQQTEVCRQTTDGPGRFRQAQDDGIRSGARSEAHALPAAAVESPIPISESGSQGNPSTAVSPKMVAANRRNALKSTGPRTAEGKMASRMNAVRHGILSSEVVVRGLRIQERVDEFKALRERCWESLAPGGAVEEMLVDKIVTAQWRMRRALTAETGEILLSVDGGMRRRENGVPVALATMMDEIHDASLSMEKSTEGLDHLGYILRRVREGMTKDGQLMQEMCEWVESRFGSQPNVMTRTLWEYWKKFRVDMAAVAPEAVADKDELKQRHQTAVERYIELKLIDYAELRRKSMEREYKEETAQQAADVLPSSEVLEKIMRYEGSLERQLYRAMNQLERLQRRREGEDVKAPLMMDVMK